MTMTSRTGHVRIERTAARPDVPSDWIVMNAPRPLYGTKEGLGYGPEGAFTVAIDPADEQAAWMVKENRGLDACTVLYLPDELLFQVGLAHYVAIASSEQMIANVVKYAARDSRIIGNHGFDVLTGGLNKSEQ